MNAGIAVGPLLRTPWMARYADVRRLGAEVKATVDDGYTFAYCAYMNLYPTYDRQGRPLPDDCTDAQVVQHFSRLYKQDFIALSAARTAVRQHHGV